MSSEIPATDSGPAIPSVPVAPPRQVDKIMMLAAVLARMGVGMLTFIVLARYLGPAPFGIIATGIAYSSFVGIVTDFGFGTYTLRRAAIDTQQAPLIVRDTLVAKAFLALVSLVICTPIAVALLPADRLLVFAFAFVGTTAYSIGDLSVIIVRARRRFDIEAKLVVATSILLMVGGAGTAAATGSVLAAAAAFAVTRLLYMVIMLFALRRQLSGGTTSERLSTRVLRILNEAKSYAADGILTNFAGQIDVLMFGALLTAHDLGIYQAGARLVGVIMPFATVLSTVYMPALAASVKDPTAFRASALRLNLEFTALALAGGIGFALAGPFVTKLLYGSRYDGLIPLWSGFGAYAILRFTSAAYGIQLTALGYIRIRIAVQIATILVFVSATFLLLPRFGLGITSSVLAFSAFPMICLYGFVLTRRARQGFGTAPILSFAIVVATAITIIAVV